MNVTYEYRPRLCKKNTTDKTREAVLNLLMFIESLFKHWWLTITPILAKSTISSFALVFLIYLFVCLFFFFLFLFFLWGPLWSWSHDSWIYSYICNQCISSLKLESRSWRDVIDTTFCDTVCQSPVAYRCFFLVLRFPPPVKLTSTLYQKYCCKWR